MDIYLVEYYSFYRVAVVGIFANLEDAKRLTQSWAERYFAESEPFDEPESFTLEWDETPPTTGGLYCLVDNAKFYAQRKLETFVISKWPLEVSPENKINVTVSSIE